MNSPNSLHAHISSPDYWAGHVYDPSNTPHLLGFRQGMRQLRHNLRDEDVTDEVAATLSDLRDQPEDIVVTHYQPGEIPETPGLGGVLKIIQDSIVLMSRFKTYIPPIPARASSEQKLQLFDERAEMMIERLFYLGGSATAMVAGPRWRSDLSSIARHTYYLQQAGGELGWLRGVNANGLREDGSEIWSGRLVDELPILPVGSVWTHQPLGLRHTIGGITRPLRKLVAASLISLGEYDLSPPPQERTAVPV